MEEKKKTENKNEFTSDELKKVSGGRDRPVKECPKCGCKTYNIETKVCSNCGYKSSIRR